MIDSKYTYGGSWPCRLTVPGQTHGITAQGFRRNGAFQESSERSWSWSSARTEFHTVPSQREEFHETSVAYKIISSSRNVLQHWFLLNGAYQYCMFVGEGWVLTKGLGLFCIHKVLPHDTENPLSSLCSFNAKTQVEPDTMDTNLLYFRNISVFF